MYYSSLHCVLGYRSYKLPPKMTQSTAFSILSISEEDEGRVLDFLRQFFFRDEPLVDYLRLVDSPDQRSVELEEYSVESLCDCEL